MIKMQLVAKIATDLLRDEKAYEFLDNEEVGQLLAKSLHYAAIGAETPAPAVYPMMRTRFIDKLIAIDVLVRMKRNLFANMLHAPRPHPNSAAGQLRREAVVSLHTVLGESGVANNPSRITYAVVPEDEADRKPARDLIVPGFGEFRFLRMARDAFEAGDDADRLDRVGRAYLRATNERAICDWVYFASRGNGSRLQMPSWDLDLDGVDIDRVHRLADAMGVRPAMNAWLEHKAKVDADTEASEQVSVGLGF